MLKKILKKYFISLCINGWGNKVVAVKDGKEYKILKSGINFRINGNNNSIVLDYSLVKKLSRKLPKTLSIYIDGDNNQINIEMPIEFFESEISMKGDNNLFKIKQTKIPVNGAYFYICQGAKVIIGKDCELTNKPVVIANNCYKSSHKVVIGDDVRIARDCIIRMSDGLAILDYDTNEAINEPEDIVIGNHCWIMTRSMIVKGAYIPDNTAVAPYSFINKKFDEEYTLLAGIPAKVKKTKFKFDVLCYYEYMMQHNKK